jgi:NAD(P)-dependent dehydrogenase (short-subunit alcohol dehydrogenase family)
MVAYNCSKAGLTGLTRTAALEGGPHKIRVNAVLPGPIDDTLLWKYLTSTEPGAADKVSVGLPCGRVGRPEDVVETVLWLCSEKASFITGQSVPVDGGLTVQ